MKPISMKMVWLQAAVICLASLLSWPAIAAPVDPAASQIETFYGALVDTMKHGEALGFSGRFDKLAPVVDGVFDLPLMTALSVGPVWSTVSDTDRKSLVAAFRRMTVANYVANFTTYDGQKFTVDPAVETRGADRIVRSRLESKGETPIAFIYRMHESGGAWKVVDIFLDGSVSQIAMRRSDFAATVRAGGATALVKKLNALADKLVAG